jgi:hypothetical protein
MAQRAFGTPKPRPRSRFVSGLTAVVSLSLAGCGAGAAGGIFGGAAVVAGGIWGVRNFLLRRKISSPGFVDALIKAKDWETIGKFLTSYHIGKKHRGNLQRALMEDGTRENLPPLTLAAIILARGDKELSEKAYIALGAAAQKSDGSDEAPEAFHYVNDWLRRYDQLKLNDMTIASLQRSANLLDGTVDSLKVAQSAYTKATRLLEGVRLSLPPALSEAQNTNAEV